MAIAIRGTTPTVDSGTHDPLSLTLTGASQPQSGDVLLIIHGNNFYTLANMPSPTVAGSTTGVVAVTNGTADFGTDGAHTKTYTYVVASTGDLTVAVNETGSADEEKLLCVYVLSGADTTTPIDVAANSTGTGAAGSITCPSVSPSSSDAYLICHFNTFANAGSGGVSPPGGMAETLDIDIGGGASAAAASLQLLASGATGTKVFTYTGSPHPTYAAVSIALKTASGAPPAAAPTLHVIRSGIRLR